MQFITPGEKVKRLRKQLKLTQDELRSDKVTRGLISMIESGKRDLTYAAAIKLSDKFNKKAEELGFALNIDANYLTRSPKEDAEVFCMVQLEDEEISNLALDEILQLAEEYDLSNVKAKIYVKKGELKEEKKDYESACSSYSEAIKTYRQIGLESELAKIYLRIAICKGKNLQHEAASVYLSSSQYYAGIYNDIEVQKSVLYNFSMCYKKMGKIDLALEAADKYLSLADITHKSYYFAFNIKALCYEALGNYDKAIMTYRILLTKISNSEDTVLGYIYKNLGVNYCHKNNFKEGKKYFEMAEDFKRKMGEEVLGVLIEKSILFIKQHMYEEAINTVEDGLKYALEYRNTEYIVKGYNILENIYIKINNLDKLQDIYFKLVNLFKVNGDKENLKAIYDKIAFMYIEQNKFELSKKYLSLSINLK